MLEQGRFELMKKDLCKAAVTIQKLKLQRDEYKVAYEMLKEESVSKRDVMRNQMYLESLRENNEGLQGELRKYCKLLHERDRSIAMLKAELSKSQKYLKSQVKTFKDIEEAREELNYEISNTTFNANNYSHYTETLSLLDTFLHNISSTPLLYKMFKSTVKCKKRFRTLVENENYSMTFAYLLKFLNELIESFKFCENSESDSISDLDSTPKAVNPKSKSYISGLKESNEIQSSRLEQLQKKLQNAIKSSNKAQSPILHKKLSNSENSKKPSTLNLSNAKGVKEKVVTYFDESLERSVRDRPGDTQDSFLEDTSRTNRNVGKSKSPPRTAVSPKGRFEEFQVPFRKIQGSASVAECLGRSQKK